MAGQLSAGGSDHGNPLTHPPPYGRHPVGAIALRGQLTYLPGSPQDILAYAKDKESIRTDVNARRLPYCGTDTLFT